MVAIIVLFVINVIISYWAGVIPGSPNGCASELRPEPALGCFSQFLGPIWPPGLGLGGSNTDQANSISFWFTVPTPPPTMMYYIRT